MKLSYDKKENRINLDGEADLIFTSGACIDLADDIYQAIENKEIPSLGFNHFRFIGKDTNFKGKIALSVQLLKLIWKKN